MNNWYKAADLPEDKQHKIYNYVGLAQKAGKVKAGDMLSLDALNKGNVRLMIAAKDLAPKVEQELKEALVKDNIPVIVLGTKLELGLAVGKSHRGLVAILDEGFTKAMVKLFNN